MTLLQISKKKGERKRRFCCPFIPSFLYRRRQEQECRWLTVTSHPQTDGIKLFVLCRESRDMVSWADPTFTLDLKTLPDNQKQLYPRCTFTAQARCRPQFCNDLVEFGSHLQIIMCSLQQVKKIDALLGDYGFSSPKLPVSLSCTCKDTFGQPRNEAWINR